MTQVSEWQEHGYTHWLRNFGGRDIRALPPDPQFEAIIESTDLPGLHGGSLLDAGCGSAKNLRWLAERIGASRVVGTEIHPGIISELSKTYPEYEFQLNDTMNLPFDDQSFDMVIVRSVFVLIDRDRLLQSIGECLRVAKTWFYHADYCPVRPYRTINKHNNAQQPCKIDINPIVRGTGSWVSVAESVVSDGNDWERFDATLFRRIPLDEAYPVRDETEFRT